MSDFIWTNQLDTLVSRFNSQFSGLTPQCFELARIEHVAVSISEKEWAEYAKKVPILSGLRFRLIKGGLDAHVVMEPRCPKYIPNDDRGSYSHPGLCGYEETHSWGCCYASDVFELTQHLKDQWYFPTSHFSNELEAKAFQIFHELCNR